MNLSYLDAGMLSCASNVTSRTTQLAPPQRCVSLEPTGCTSKAPKVGYLSTPPEWLLFLGDSVLRNSFQQLARTLCSAQAREPAFKLLLRQSKTDYHNARFFCFSREANDIAGVHQSSTRQKLRCSAAWVADDRNQSSVETACSACDGARRWSTTTNTTGSFRRHATKTTCVSFEWGSTWKRVENRLRRARNNLSPATEIPRTCGCWPPRAMVINSGLHEVMHQGPPCRPGDSRRWCPREVDGHNSSGSGLFKSVDWQVRWVVHWCREHGVHSLLVQLASGVQNLRIQKVWKRVNLTNNNVRLYNANLRNLLTINAGRQHSVEHGQLCITLLDAFSVTRHLVSNLSLIAPDGLHWAQP